MFIELICSSIRNTNTDKYTWAMGTLTEAITGILGLG
jgi:hypothetical protein